jgi:hypothetical protein
MNIRFYIYFAWVLNLSALSYIERWIDQGYSLLWFLFTLGAVFFLAMCKHQIQVDRNLANIKNKKHDNPF